MPAIVQVGRHRCRNTARPLDRRHAGADSGSNIREAGWSVGEGSHSSLPKAYQPHHSCHRLLTRRWWVLYKSEGEGIVVEGERSNRVCQSLAPDCPGAIPRSNRHVSWPCQDSWAALIQPHLRPRRRVDVVACHEQRVGDRMRRADTPDGRDLTTFATGHLTDLRQVRRVRQVVYDIGVRWSL